jgi:two-component system sensor histidine kinase KdpD
MTLASDAARPDPDRLIERLRGDAARAARGRLRIYFGASPGVGKTFAMLAAARKARAEGRDVVGGIVETHGRAETAALLEGLELLPRRTALHGGRPLEELDVDAALARRPALLLVDELAHTNVRGSRHARRWQDVEDLLAAGIDVWTTLNVQHLESLNDVVGGITGVAVRETLPDTFFDRAEELVLVDVSAEELVARLAAGKVYVAGQAERAAKNFFRKGNLMALRELALRRTADRVEDDVQAYRTERSIDPVWRTGGGLLACIGPDRGAERVVRATAQLAQQLAVEWHAVYVETPRLQRLGEPERHRILRTVRLAESLGGRSAVLAEGDVAAALVEHARRHNLARLVSGRPATARRPFRPTLPERLARAAPDLDLVQVADRRPGAADLRGGAEPGAGAHAAAAEPGLAERARPYAVAAGASLLTALACGLAIDALDTTNIAMLFLLAVVAVAGRLGRGPAVLAAVLNVAVFDYVFVEPRWSFAVTDVQYLVTFGVMLAVGLVVGQLTASFRFQARVARHREARSTALFEMARGMSAVLGRDEAIEVGRAAVAREFRAEAALFVLDAGDRLVALDPAAGADAGTAHWVLDHRQPAGLGTDTLAGTPWHYVPLLAPMRARGVLAVKPASPRLLQVPEQRRQLDAFAALLAMAIERVHYAEVAQAATVQIESERLRNSLLAALSHDVRTPLAALVALADSLRLQRPPLPPEPAATAEAIREEAMRMSAMVANLLDMARLQSGAVRLRREWQSVEELVGAAIRSARASLGARPVTVSLPADLPLVECDAVLVERVLANLLENAGKHTPAGTPVHVGAAVEGDADGGPEARWIRIDVRDHGPGVPAAQRDAVFDAFVRGSAEQALPGVGLGLAIARTIVSAHGGRIGVADAPGGGAVFSVRLPAGTPPALEAPEPVRAED